MAARYRGRQHQRQNTAERSGERCSVCVRRILPRDQARHQGYWEGCNCPYHAECLIGSIQQGRVTCDCGAYLYHQGYVKVVVPRAIATANEQSSDEEPEDPFIQPCQDLASYGNECPICSYPLVNPEQASTDDPYCRPMNCQHEFHMKCILETAFDSVRPRAHEHQHEGWTNRQTKCPVCRRDFLGLIPLPVNSAPSVLVHYDAMERQISTTDRPNSTGNSMRHQQVQEQSNGWMVAAITIIGGISAVLLILFGARS